MSGNDRRTRRRTVLKGMGAAGVAGLTGLAGCAQGGGGGASGPDAVIVIGYPQDGTQLFRDYYSSTDASHEILVPDGLRDDNLPQDVGSAMSNVTGTAPGASGPNREDFVSLFEEEYGTDPGVFTPHTYDSVAVQILANTLAGENSGPAVRAQMRRVANGEGMSVGPSNLPEGVAAAAAGEDVTYEGGSSAVDFNELGDPASATYNVWSFEEGGGTTNEDSLNFEGNPVSPETEIGPGGEDRTVKVGVLLPETGNLGSLGKPMINAAQLCIKQVNDSDAPITVDSQVEDTQTNRQASLSGANALINAGYPSVCGTASSGNNIPTSQQVFIPNEVVGCSPSSTALTVSNLDDNDYIFRTAPSDLLQGQVMAQVTANRLEASTASTLYVNNDYGQQLSQQFADTFENEHDGSMWNQVAYHQGESSYTSTIETALQEPDN